MNKTITLENLDYSCLLALNHLENYTYDFKIFTLGEIAGYVFTAWIMRYISDEEHAIISNCIYDCMKRIKSEEKNNE